MLSPGLEVALWMLGFLVALIFYGIATDPSRKKGWRSKRAELAERWLDGLDQGGPRD